MESGRKLKRPEEKKYGIKALTPEEEIARTFGQKEIRFHSRIATDVMRSVGRMKAWNNYPPNEFEKIFVEQGLIPIGYYYSTFDVDTEELIFLSQDNYVPKKITRIRWKINKWFIMRGW